jgi:acetyl esterase/lipase
MSNQKYQLWSESEMNARSGSGVGTFKSCIPSITYYPTNAKHKHGCVIVCPGGGYEMKTMDYEGEEIAQMLNKNGIAAFVLDYRIKPDYHPAPVNDAFRAIEKVRALAEELGYISDKIAILGFSAGGHLAASAGTMWTTTATRPDAMVLCYPVITMGKTAHVGSKTNLIGDRITEALVSDLSCENRVSRQTPPTFIWHTADDKAVQVENSLTMASALASKAVPFEMHIYPHGEHGLALAKDDKVVSGWFGLCVDWLKRLGF